MIGVVVALRMGQDQRRPELAINIDQLPALQLAVDQLAIGKSAEEQRRPEKLCRRLHLASAHSGQILDRLSRLPLAPIAQNTNANLRALGLRPRERPGAEQLRVVRVRDHCQNAFVGKIEFHRLLVILVAFSRRVIELRLST